MDGNKSGITKIQRVSFPHSRRIFPSGAMRCAERSRKEKQQASSERRSERWYTNDTKDSISRICENSAAFDRDPIDSLLGGSINSARIPVEFVRGWN